MTLTVPNTGKLFYECGARARLLCALAALLLLLPAFASAQADTTPPVLTALSFGATSIDVTSGSAALTVNLTITDDLSGFYLGSIEFTSPSGQIAGGVSGLGSSGGLSASDRTSGTDLDGTYQTTVVFPQYSEPGVWQASVYLRDNAGNSITLPSSTLVSDGFPGSITVTDSNPDTTPPTLLGASFSPSTIDTSSGPQTVTLTLQAADSQSGVSFSSLAVYISVARAGDPATLPLEVWASNIRMVLGTAQNGVWQANLTFPQYSSGSWSISSLSLTDADSNRVNLTPGQLIAMGINPILTDSSTPSDITPPTLTGLSFSPLVINTSTGIQDVTVDVSASDNLSGVYFGEFNSTYVYITGEFQSPSGNQTVYFLPTFSPTGQPPIAGTALSGTWQFTAQWPQFSEEGTWTLQYFILLDGVGNHVNFSPTTLSGFPATIVVTKPSLAPDGIIGPSGGTVDDNSFGSRASVTFPPGLVSAPTTVSIDVFATPLSVPTPRGFTMPGTYFENLSFTPALPEPIPAPGITVVLPLVNQMAPGATLSLYHIDPVTGVLSPAMNASGNPVTGTVNADGLGATFNNVVTFSTVVAYISTGSVLGDVNGDGVVNCTDVSIVKSAFGKRAGQPGFNSAADLNNDGVVNILDLFIVSRQLSAGLVCH